MSLDIERELAQIAEMIVRLGRRIRQERLVAEAEAERPETAADTFRNPPVAQMGGPYDHEAGEPVPESAA